ncbi:signal transduction histidine kinase [Cellulophaga lytica DSM 7489]|uniref:histidine kinase n=1 Tax=Cellulophaga lytica (strain ATCC 23178 / DSM 7489 / JCM 8516 / NBRC 14961 / NCIMB 1423 / VKM B-1433 / Cy l20) TaxID=867900 RepID=F0RAE6_CELLC|nr:histidine kinase dimerization/phosphoacceptor domain -containing protein [Cellulophaga lytica]ADY30509.1 signal transduction histidine kinase [Cellulophaga lytica DSM 7489]
MITKIAKFLSNNKNTQYTLKTNNSIFSFKTYIAVFFFSFVFINLSNAQEIQLQQTVLDSFVKIPSAKDKFAYFYKTPNRYKENSSYEWLERIDSMLTKARNAQDDGSVEYYRILQAHIHQDLVQYDKSIAITNELYIDKTKLSDTLKSALLDIMDENYSQLKLYEKQIAIRKEKKELGLADNISFYDIYADQGLYQKARSEYIREKSNVVSSDDYYGQAVYNNKIGDFLRLDKSSQVALEKYQEARKYINTYLDTIARPKTEDELAKGALLKGVIEGNIGKCYMLLKRYEEAIPLLDSSLVKIREFNVEVYSQDAVENTLDLANCYLQTNKLDKVLELINDDLRAIKVSNVLRKNQLLAVYYQKMNDYKKANYYLNNNIKINDSIRVNETLKKHQQIATVFEKELENSEDRLDEKKIELENAKIEAQASDERMSLILISLIFTLLGLGGLVFAYIKSIKNQRVIAKQNNIIESQLTEKDSLLKEIHHRVKNNLQMVSSLLSLQTKNTKSKAAIMALEEGKSRVKAMALIHQKLYQNDDLSVIEMQGYVESLVNSVQSVFKKGGHNINITIDAEGVELDIDRAIPFGLILNELVSNSFKYAFPDNDENGKIYIHLRNTETGGYFEYTDNGVGLPEDTDERTKSSMGIRLMNRLVNQLQSTLNIDKSVEGVRFWFNFK